MPKLLSVPLACALLALSACAAPVVRPPAGAPRASAPVEVQILAINDFHGNLEPPKLSIEADGPDGKPVRVPAGGIAHLATAAKALRAGQTHTITVAAGDLIGASPLVSALFLDEPTIDAMDLVGLELNAVGNHEFDKGTAELMRMQRGGCETYTTKQPCRLGPFDGASFRYLAANVLNRSGGSLFPGTAIKDFGLVKIGFIGMTLKETADIVSPAGVSGVTFTDEAATANALVPQLQAQGANAIVILIHQGGRTKGRFNDKSCPGLDGDILPILSRLDPAIDLVISGHTHASYICELPRSGTAPLLLTSAGQYGTLISDIRLTFSPDKKLTSRRADNIIVQGEPYSTSLGDVAIIPTYPVYPADAELAAFVGRYVDAAASQAQRVVGRLSGAATRAKNEHREQVAGDFIADAQLFAARKAGAQIAFVNQGGVRADLIPASDGNVTYGQIFSMQPFGNSLVVMDLTGAQLKALLEQQFTGGKKSADDPTMLLASEGFFFSYDGRRADGDRIVDMRLDGKRIDPADTYRVTTVNFLASGGDGFTTFKQGTDVVDAGLDLDATEAYLKTSPKAPALGRIRNLAPAPPSPVG